jgi:zinc protease
VIGLTFRTIAQESGVEELLLEANGLRVLLLPDQATPVVSACVVYHVGSRNEATGHTGATHLLEHLMFKGSRRFDPRSGRPIARTLERVGASFNATTWFDRTNYYETLSPEHLELALELEADRMRHALLREEDLASEMTVVRNEFERGENEPFDALLKDSFATAFREHPYHHPTIGWRSDIENASIARLREFYDTYYQPDNATLVLVGAFERATALGLVEHHFAPLPPATRPIDQTVTAEPPQQGERRFVLRRAGEVGWVAVSWRTPEASHPDTHALAVLADAVASGVTSRLFQRLVEPGTCLDVQAVAWLLRDPGLFQVFATLNQGSSHEAVETAIRDEVARVARDGIGADELERATVQVEAHTAYHRDSPTQVAAALAEALSASSCASIWSIRSASARSAATTSRGSPASTATTTPCRSAGSFRGTATPRVAASRRWRHGRCAPGRAASGRCSRRRCGTSHCRAVPACACCRAVPKRPSTFRGRCSPATACSARTSGARRHCCRTCSSAAPRATDGWSWRARWRTAASTWGCRARASTPMRSRCRAAAWSGTGG